MNELRKLANTFFHREPQAPKDFDQHGLDHDPRPPVLSTKSAQLNQAILQKKPADVHPPQDALRATATQPSYRKTAQDSGSQGAQGSASASSPRPDAESLQTAIEAGDLATIGKYITDKVDLASLSSTLEQPAIRIALKCKNLQMIKLLLPHSSHADKLEALALVTETHRAHRNGLKPGVAAILDSVNRENRNDAGWEKRQEEITAMTKLLARFQ